MSVLASRSERADPNYCRDRITEGSNINKSLVTLGIVISALGVCGVCEDSFSGASLKLNSLSLFQKSRQID